MRAKAILKEYPIHPDPFIVELDQRGESLLLLGHRLLGALLTNRRHVHRAGPPPPSYRPADCSERHHSLRVDRRCGRNTTAPPRGRPTATLEHQRARVPRLELGATSVSARASARRRAQRARDRVSGRGRERLRAWPSGEKCLRERPSQDHRAACTSSVQGASVSCSIVLPYHHIPANMHVLSGHVVVLTS